MTPDVVACAWFICLVRKASIDFVFWVILNLVNHFCGFMFRNLEELVLIQLLHVLWDPKVDCRIQNLRCSALS